MAEATTEDCKAFIEINAKAMGWPEGEKWKRESKIKTDQGWERVFKSASGSLVSIIEPFGEGAAGLRAGGFPPAPATGPDFDSASPELQAAMRWIDAMRVIGGKKAIHSKDAGDGWSWGRFKKGIHDFTGALERGDAYEKVENWLEDGMRDEVGASMMKARCAWCFSSDADYLESVSCWDAGEAALVCVWALDCPDEELGWLPHPMQEMSFMNSMEGVYEAGGGEPTGVRSMIAAWEQLHAAGMAFDLKGQKDYGQDADFDEACPLEKKVLKVIPELIARKEAKTLAQATGSAPAPAAPRRRSI